MLVAAFTNLLAGFATDNLNRKYVSVFALIVMSAATAAMGFAQTYWHVLVARIMQAAGQAFAPPLAYSMIADLFGKDQRASASGVYASGVYVGYGASSLSLLLIAREGWRFTSYTAGITGAVLVVALATFVSEPLREAYRAKKTTNVVTTKADGSLNNDIQSPLLTSESSDAVDGPASPNDVTTDLPASDSAAKVGDITVVTERPSIWRSMALAMQPTDMRVMIVASAFRMAGGIVMGSFLPAYFKQHFPSQRDQFAIINSIVVATAGTMSSLFGGRLADLLMRRASEKLREEARTSLLTTSVNGDESASAEANRNVEEVEAKIKGLQDLSPFALCSALSCILSVPFFVGVFFIPNLYAAMAMLFLAYLLSECWYAPTFCIIHNYTAVPAHVKGVATSIMMAGTSIIACGAPVLVGAIDDKYNSVQWEMVGGVLVPNFIGGLLFLIVYAAQKRFAKQRASNIVLSGYQ